MNVKPYILTVVNALLLCMGLLSCGSGEQEPFDAVERLLETDPAKADTLLSSIPEPGGRGRKAWYAVLKTQLDYKLYREIESDSLIKTATEYYRTPYKNVSRLRRYRAAMAWYSQGCVYSELGNNYYAINAYLNAIDLFPDTLIRYYALAELNLGKCYIERAMYGSALSFFIPSRDNGLRLNDSSIVSYADYWIATIGLRNEHFSEVYDSFMRLQSNSSLPAFYRSESLLQLAKIHLFGHSNCDSALHYLNRYLSETPGFKGAGYSLKGDAFYRLSEYDSAYSYFIKSSEYPCDVYSSCENSRRLYELSAMLGDTATAAEYASAYSELLDSIRVIRETDDIAKLEIAHGAEIASLHERVFKIRFFAVCLILVVLLALSSIIIIQRLRNLYDRNYIQLSDESWNNPENLPASDATPKEMLESGKKIWQKSPSFRLYSRTGPFAVVEKRERIVYVHDLTLSFSRIISYYKVNFPYVNADEMLQMIMCYLQFDKTLICSIINLSDDTFRKNKSRLKEKLGDQYELFFVPVN